ncbi:ABC transporter substrate-binding protein [uncultured Draconibacterium sp.]|uniref:ABC transporter substrate-binding protein n=1 Tax=uncultured Draconibacterium sp. TaxID=1573823 RepID=UPI002AA78713|nr:ABC transporter substrate-binding protein [uncultured Draconibacterium sp.]
MNSRRNFLRIAGAGITGSFLQPFTSNGAVLKTKGQKIKIGVLMPQSIEHPGLPVSFMNGFRSGIDQHGAFKKNRIELITEMVNFGTPHIVKEKSQKLIVENNVDLVVGILNSEVASHVGETFKNAKLPAFFVNSGESYPVNEIKNNSYLFLNSLNLYQAAFHSGQYAVEKFGKKIAIVTSFYDSGYDALFTFRQGVEAAGGDIPDTYLMGENSDDFVADTMAKLNESRPDAVYVFMHGTAAEDIIQSLHINALKLPILTTAFVVEDERLLHLGEAGENVLSVSSWNRSSESEENRKFDDLYAKHWKKSPDLFSVLGYESGMIIYDSLTRCKQNFTSENIADNLRSCSITSPRGKVFIHQDSGIVNNPLYLNKSTRMLSGSYGNQVLQAISPVNEFEERFAMLDNAYRSGWLNPYLFV